MNEEIEQTYLSRIAKGIYRDAHDSISLMKWMTKSNKADDKINYFDLVASVLSCSNGIF